MRRTTSLSISTPKAKAICWAMRGHLTGIAPFHGHHGVDEFLVGSLRAGSTPALGRKQQAVLSFPQQVVQRQPGGGLPHDGGTEDACRAQEEEEQAGGDAIRGAEVGPPLAPPIEDKQLMADHRRFGNHGPESPWPCQSDHGDDHMDQQDHEVAHPGNSNNTSQAAVFRPISNSPWTP